MSNPRYIFQIAAEIRKDWKKVYFGAAPYLDAMESLATMESKFFYDDADSIIRYFLANASTWRGETAKRIKAELKSMIKHQ